MSITKYSFVVLILFLCSVSFGQNDTVYISGHVSAENSSGKTELIKRAWIHLKLSNGGMFESSSNDSGYYSFKVKAFNGIGELSVGTDKNTSFVTSKTYGFLANKTTYTLSFSEPKKYVYDFSITKVIICWSFPTVSFKFNSTEPILAYSNGSSESPDESASFIASVLEDSPTIIIQIDGHCDRMEKDQENLSIKRAEYFAEELAKKGIARARLTTKGYGSQKPWFKEDFIKKAKAKEEKEAIRQRNRRVSFRIISWDYVDPNNPVPKPETKSKENSEFIED